MPAEQHRHEPTIADLRASRSLREVRPHLAPEENAALSSELETDDFWTTLQRWRATADYRSDATVRHVVDEIVARPPRPTLSAAEMAARLGVTLPAA